MTTPTIYLLHGDDEFAMAGFVQGMQAKMGDSTTANMNTTRLEGRSFSLAELESVASATPFLAPRRLAIVVRPISLLRSQADRQKFTDLLGRLPPTTALVLLEEPLKDSHWLLKWALKAGDRVWVKAQNLPKGPELAKWIRAQARERGGDFTPEAAAHLASLVADDNRMASSEIDKLLAYVNCKRPVEFDDVEMLTPSVQTGDVFQMVDAIGSRQGKLALKILHQQLGERDPLSLLGMITRQFRLLMLTKEMMEWNASSNEIAHALNVRDFVVRKLVTQCRNFDLPLIEAIYRKLAEVDENIKTGKIEAETALDTLVAGLTS
ncbi:MAG TPA: DNA polymerase III subunit delta [Anaerolineales bacterium]|nr:DNA polymerase III subunit delta [Anaerolineales bacterium]